jgi:peptidyl-prolyl cis-trans isomerase SurA
MLNVSREFGGILLLQQAELDFSPAEKPTISKLWALALGFLRPALKRTISIELSSLLSRQATALSQSATLLFVISTGTRISCQTSLEKAACAAFVKKSSMKCGIATKFHWKSGAAKRSGEISVLPAIPGNVFRRPSGEKRITLAAAILLASILSTPAWAQQPAPSAIPPGAVVLDHVVAVINGSVILESDVKEEMNYAVLQPFSINSARNTPERALQRLIDRALILQQMKTGGDTVAPPTPEELQEQIHQLRGLIPQCMEYRCQTEAGWQAFLSSRGLTEKEVEKHWSQRMLILSFIQARFGSGVRITPAEIKNYYDKTLVPRLNGVTPPPLANVSTRIEEILLQQRVSSLLLEWLQSLKSEGSVSILDPAYGKVGTTGSGDESESGGQS